MTQRKASESGVHVYPPMPLPRGRESEPRMAKRARGPVDKKLAAMLGGAAIVGIIAGFLVRPLIAPDARVDELSTRIGETQKVAAAEKARADETTRKLDEVTLQKSVADTQLAEAQKAQTELASKAADAEAKAKELAADQAKLKAAVDKSIGTISADGLEIKLQLVDRVLFKTGEDQLTEQGKKVMDRVASALKQIPDKQIWVHGHTDDQPIYIAPRPPSPPTPKGKKGAKAPTPKAPEREPDGKFATNWELSAARALTVVHYLQDIHKIDGGRLAALAFSQYRPVSKTNKALNRRIEIVLYPRAKVAK